MTSEGDGTENIVYHENLFALLAVKDPKLADARFTAGWLTQTGNEAALYVARVISATRAKEIGAAMTGWCEANGITKLVISDPSAHRSNGLPQVSVVHSGETRDRWIHAESAAIEGLSCCVREAPRRAGPAGLRAVLGAA